MLIRLFEIEGDKNNDTVLEHLRKLKDVTVSEVICPTVVGELYVMPFIEVKPRGGKFFGLEDIEDFVKGEMSADTHARAAAP